MYGISFTPVFWRGIFHSHTVDVCPRMFKTAPKFYWSYCRPESGKVWRFMIKIMWKPWLSESMNFFQVIPQLIARIDTPRALVGRLIHQLLTDIGRYHPQVLYHGFPIHTTQSISKNTLPWLPSLYLQALIYPLTVASKSTTTARHNAANKILKNMCEHCNTLVQQAMMVETELFTYTSLLVMLGCSLNLNSNLIWIVLCPYKWRRPGT